MLELIAVCGAVDSLTSARFKGECGAEICMNKGIEP